MAAIKKKCLYGQNIEYYQDIVIHVVLEFTNSKENSFLSEFNESSIDKTKTGGIIILCKEIKLPENGELSYFKVYELEFVRPIVS